MSTVAVFLTILALLIIGFGVGWHFGVGYILDEWHKCNEEVND